MSALKESGEEVGRFGQGDRPGLSPKGPTRENRVGNDLTRTGNDVQRARLGAQRPKEDSDTPSGHQYTLSWKERKNRLGKYLSQKGTMEGMHRAHRGNKETLRYGNVQTERVEDRTMGNEEECLRDEPFAKHAECRLSLKKRGKHRTKTR